MKNRKPTIQELEKLLEGPNRPITVLPNGEIRVFSREEAMMRIIVIWGCRLQMAWKDLTNKLFKR